MDNHLLFKHSERVTLEADSVYHVFQLPTSFHNKTEVSLAELQLTAPDGSILSRNIYWLAATSASLRELNAMPRIRVQINATAHYEANETILDVTLDNPGSSAALMNKLTVSDQAGQRILPAYYSDNYVSLLPGEQAKIRIHIPSRDDMHEVNIDLRGWNALAVQQTTYLPVHPH